MKLVSSSGLGLAVLLLAAGCAARLPEAPKTLTLVPAASSPSAKPSTASTPPPPSPKEPLPTQVYLDQGLHNSRVGTGFFVHEDGRLVTNNHVIDKCDSLSVETTDGTTVLARLLATDPPHDLALVQMAEPAPAVATFREKVSMDGRKAVVIGYPSQGMPRIKPNLTPGTLSGPVLPDGHRFTFAADIHPGNSGGPLLDEAALVVGVVFAKINPAAVYQNTGQHAEKLGFAITNETVLGFLAANGVNAALATTPPQPRDDEALFADGRRFIARIVCWTRK